MRIGQTCRSFATLLCLSLLLQLHSFNASAQFTKLLDFTGANGFEPRGSLITDGTFLYGMTNLGGVNSIGTIFKVKPDGTGYVKLFDFTVASGSHPAGSLYYDGTFLYGMTTANGASALGSIFKIKPDGTGFLKLLDFTGTANGASPYGSFISDGTFLYGMTSLGGASNSGTVFKIKPDGTGYALLVSLNTTVGRFPYGSLYFDGTFLYGMASSGGTSFNGTIFKVLTDGTSFSKIFDFTGSATGGGPQGSLISDGTYLYGMTEVGGANGDGCIFKILPTGAGYVRLVSFNGTNGGEAFGDLTLIGSYLYGMTYSGGSNLTGNLFRVKPDGTGLITLWDFNNAANGWIPYGNLITDGAFLYGMTQQGGPSDGGVVFKYQLSTVPSIASFTPSSGPIGTTVTLTGANFDPVATNNIVYFGAVRATVTGGNTTQLTVTVPAGATYEPVSVTASGLTGFSAKPFLVTYPGSSIINTCAFASKVDFAAGTTGQSALISDIDGDGKSDLISVNPSLNVVSILRNTTTTGVINAGSFAPRVDIATGLYPNDVSADDIDGDGKLDLVVVIANDNGISVLRNTSTPGNISFAPKQDYLTGVNARFVAVADFDGDGRPDVAVPNNFSKVSIFRNVSSPGTINLNPKIDFTTGANPNSITVADFDGDSRPDIATAGISGSNKISIIKNNSTPGVLAFATNVDFNAANAPLDVTAGDIDNDGLMDIVTGGNIVGVISVLRNTGTPGTITAATFAARVDYPAILATGLIALEDLDGDGRLDIVANANSANIVMLFRNTSTPGVINASSFAPRLNLAAGISPQTVVTGDLDGDGRPELVANNLGTNLGVFLNTIPLAQTITSVSPNIGPVGTPVTITGTNFHPTPAFNAVYFNGVFSATIGSTATTVNTTVPAGAASGFVTISVACATATSPSVFTVTPDITSFSPTQGPIGTTVTINGSAFSGTPANNFVYFGATRATVSAASPTQLTVTAPVGATYEPISVTVGGATAYADRAFLVTFPGGGSFSSCSFGVPVTFGQSNYGVGLATGDLDGDGKADIAAVHANNSPLAVVQVFRNTSTVGVINTASLAAPLDLPAGNVPNSVAIGDIDGDGKPDIVATINNDNLVALYRNTSSIGSLSFASRVDLTAVFQPSAIVIKDLDGDGRPDLAVADNQTNSISIWRNISSPGSLSAASFDTRFSIGTAAAGLSGFDIDLDGKIDLVSGYGIGAAIGVLRNISSPGSLSAASFSSRVDFPTPAWTEFVDIGDLDTDGKPDIVASSWPGAAVGILKNTSTPGSVSFASVVTLSGIGEARGVVITDMDGDGLPDITVLEQVASKAVVYKNMTTPGVINSGSFGPQNIYTAGGNLRSAAADDIDGDGRPEIIVTNFGGPLLSVLHNEVLAPPTLTGFSPSSGSVGTTVTITGTGFSTNLSSNIVAINGTNAHVVGATPTTLTVVVAAGSTTGPIAVTVNCNVPVNSAPSFTVTPLSYNNCATVTLNGTGDYIQVTRNASLEPASLTIEALVNFNSDPSFSVIIAKPDGTPAGDSYAIWRQGGFLHAGVRLGGSINTFWTPTLGQWYHIALTYNSVSQIEKLYVDGVVVATGVSLPPVYSANNLFIGSDTNFSIQDGFFPGKVDEVRFWNTDRTALQIVSNLTTSLVGNESGLVAYYRIGETGQGNGITVVNSATATGATNNGVTVGTATTPVFQGFCSCVPAQERNALIALYNSTNGASWVNKTNWLTVDEGTWNGVVLSGCHVTEIQLDFNNLVGPIPPEIGDLTELQHLSLSGNQLNGTLPNEVTNLTNLQYLFINNNSIGGGLPANIGNMTSLIGLDTQSNLFTGPIPPSLASCTQLANLQLEGNQHTGSIPAFLGTANFNLQSINLGFNQFTGSIPSQLGNLANLSFLSLADNDLTGSIPTTLGNLDQLGLIDLSRNRLSGPIPTQLGNCSNLGSLQLWDNQLDGLIPSSLGNLSNLMELNLSQNLLYGEIPPELGNLSSLQYLSIHTNGLYDDIPAELGSLNSLTYLDLHSNALSLSLPPELGNLSSLQNLLLNSNQLSGPIPPEFGNLSMLTELRLNNNFLDGTVPASLTSISGLAVMDLSNNSLFVLPAAFGSMASLVELNLSTNAFSAIPVFTSPGLTLLAVKNNFLTFDVLEPNVGVTGFTYSPQYDLPPGGTINFTVGSTLTIPFSSPGTANSYQWYLGTIPVPGATSSSLTRPSMTLADAGFYTLKITNSIVTGLVLQTVPYLAVTNPCSTGGPDGSIDALFDPLITDNNIVSAIERQSDGKIILGVPNTTIDDNPYYGIVRFNTDGTIDPAFNVYGAQTNPNTLLVQPDNKILFTDFSYDGYVQRLNSDGTPDEGFNDNAPSYYNGQVLALALQPNGKIIVSRYIDTGPVELERLNADGTIDGSFSAPSVSGLDMQVIKVQADGKILVGGDFGIARIMPDGSPDSGFAIEGPDGAVFDMAIQPDGKIMVVGDFTSFNGSPFNLIVRLKQDGTIDDTFRVIGLTEDLEAGVVPRKVAILPDGKIIVSGIFNSINGANRADIVRLNTDGTVDCSFDPGPATDGTLYDLEIQADGKILAIGEFVTYAGATRNGFVRINNTTTGISCVPVTERNALIALYTSTNGTGWTNKTNWLSTDEATWFGVTVSGCHVINVQVPSNNLVGTIPTQLGNLTELVYLDLMDNHLSGSIPVALGSLDNVVGVNLSKNQLTGTIPPELGNMASLEFLEVYTNQLSGTIPPALFNATTIAFLRLSDNQLTGTIPSAVGNLPDIFLLEMDRNQLTGPVPPELGNDTQLKYLHLNQNQLSASIPTALGNLTALIELDISANQLTGAIPVTLGSLPNLEDLSLYDNQLTGIIPTQLGNLTSLKHLNLYMNQLTGPIPVELGNLSNLEVLDIFINQLTGPLPKELANCTNLRDLEVAENQLSGTLPKELGSIPNLRVLQVGYNNFTGAVPVEYAAWTAIEEILISDNQLDAMPAFTASTIVQLEAQNNLFEFGDLEPNIGVAGYTYSPQADLPGGSITVNAGSPLTIPFSTSGSANQYQWFKNGVLIPGATSATFSIASPTVSDAGSYTVAVTNTIVTGLTINSLPFVVSVTPVIVITLNIFDQIVCEGNLATFVVAATGTTNITYQWQYSPDGIVPFVDITNTGGYSGTTTPSLSINTAGPFGAGRYQCRINGDLAVQVLSYDEGLFINTPPAAPATTGNSGCAFTSISISASGGVNGQYRWYTVSTGGTAIAGQVNDTYLTPALSTTTIYFAAINNGTCESTRTPVTATVLALPASPTVTGALGCAPSASLTLNAAGGSAGEYRWYTVATGGSPIAGETNSSYITPTISTTTTYYVSINNSICESFRVPVDAQIRDCTPIITAMSKTTPVGSSVSIDIAILVTVISDPIDVASIKVISQPISGAVATITNGVLEVNYNGVAFAGTDRLTIEACDLAGHCAQQEITIEVVGDITVYNAVSPNGDGKNDTFIIQYIEALPETKNNKVTIFNRWGTVVYEETNYDNANKVFKGLSNSGDELPSGTYFYTIEFTSGEPKRNGFISLRR